MLNASFQPVPEPWFVAALAAATVLAALLLILRSSVPGGLWRTGALALALLGAWIVADGLARLDRKAMSQVITARAADLEAQARAPGSVLACLDRVDSAELEEGCRGAIFRTPERVAAALGHVKAQLVLLEDADALEDGTRVGVRPLQRIRQRLAADPFGLVAHVLVTRGCSAARCPAYAHLGESDRIVAHMKAGTFEAAIATRVASWQRSDAAGEPAAAPAVSVAPTSAVPTWPDVGAANVSAGTVAPGASVADRLKDYDFPSADSIPAVSIMSAEPTAPREKTPVPLPRR